MAPIRELPRFRDLRAFLTHLGGCKQLVRVAEPVSTVHEMTEIHRRTIESRGPALVFERAMRADGSAAPMPVLVNLFGTVERVAWGMGVEQGSLRAVGDMLASLRDPQPINGLGGALERWPLVKAAFSAIPTIVKKAPAHQDVRTGADADLLRLPAQTCWPGEGGPLITWPLVISRPPGKDNPLDYNMGVYRMQVVDRHRAVVRWLAHRGGAAHHRLWAAAGQPMPVAVVVGADPATMISAVLPLPEGVSELHVSGILRGERPRLARCATVPLLAPADAEIIIEGYVSADETAPEGPFVDHTGYYNAVEPFPLLHVTAMTTRSDPTYVSTFTARPPDEPSIIGEALNELFIPVLRRQVPEVVDCWFPPDACSYRMAVISIRKRYPGQARRVMMALWGMLAQFSYTKLILVVDDDIDVRDWRDISWAVATRADPSRDLMLIERTPIDHLDFASPVPGLGGKLGIDATNKIGPETQRTWAKVAATDPAVSRRVDAIWDRLGLATAPPPGCRSRQ